MKKFAVIALAIVMSLALVACGSSGSKIKDGTYTAEASEANYGYTTYLKLTYLDGKVTDVEFDAVDAEGTLKSTLTAEEYPMDPAPDVWFPELTANIKKAIEADSTDVEAVAGATNTSNDAKLLLEAALKAAKEGNTEVVKVDLPTE
jgi:major membrane immunogen (membrane-anchored lipoprotein)